MSKPISNNELDSFEEFFSDTLKDSSMLPSDKVWQQIEHSLNKDGRKKRGFFWLIFCGLIFMGASISIYFFMLNKEETRAPKTAVAKEMIFEKTKKESLVPAEASNNITEKEAVNEEKINTIKIQLGAFKNQIDKTVFDKTGLNIKSVVDNNSITHYYVEVSESQTQQVLQQIKQNGFAGAFIKRNLLVAKNNKQLKEASHQENEPNLIAKNEVTFISKKANYFQNNNNNVPAINSNKANSNLPKEKLAFTPNQNKLNDLKNDLPQPKEGNTIKNSINNLSAGVTENTVVKDQIAVIVPKDSSQKGVIENIAMVKKDSVSLKTDSVTTNNPIAKKDSVNELPLLNRWSLAITGGPNIFLKNIHNSLFDNSGEKQPITYHTNLKIEYRLFKKISVSLGVNYSYFIAKQDATLFYFNKNLTSDFIFYSSFGPMAVDKNTMLQGFSPMAPVTMFQANYSYTSKINTLVIPIEAKFYYLNRKKINLYTSLGVSGMFVLSEKTNLSIIKEHVTNNVSFNQITTTKANALLMLGLGGDVKLFKQLYFTVDAGFRYSVNNLSNTAGIKTIPTYFSINGGLKIKF
ncbi:MAG: outer membrane beta-barrel protein [Bacteroidia bacterium]